MLPTLLSGWGCITMCSSIENALQCSTPRLRHHNTWLRSTSAKSTECREGQTSPWVIPVESHATYLGHGCKESASGCSRVALVLWHARGYSKPQGHACGTPSGDGL